MKDLEAFQRPKSLLYWQNVGWYFDCLIYVASSCALWKTKPKVLIAAYFNERFFVLEGITEKTKAWVIDPIDGPIICRYWNLFLCFELIWFTVWWGQGKSYLQLHRIKNINTKDMWSEDWLWCNLVNNQPDVQFLFLYLFIPILYMFRGTKCWSSGESTVSIRTLVYVTVCRWPCGIQV